VGAVPLVPECRVSDVEGIIATSESVIRDFIVIQFLKSTGRRYQYIKARNQKGSVKKVCTTLLFVTLKRHASS
jgi:hypothetical protein